MRSMMIVVMALAVAIPAYGAEITGFYIADVLTDETLKEIAADEVIELDDYNTDFITVYAKATDDTKGVRTRLDGVEHFEHESPYAAFEDNPTWNFPDDQYLTMGRHTFQARPYAQSHFRSGGDTVSIGFRVNPRTPRCEFDVEVETCDLESIIDAVEEAVDAGDAEHCNVAQFELEVARVCADARVEADAGTPLEDLIEEFDTQDVENYFNGGTYWNENTGDVNEDVGGVIERIYDDVAQSATISYPDNIDTFAECDQGAVFCVWIRDRQARDNNGNCNNPLDVNCVDADPADNTDLCYSDASRAPSASHVAAGYGWFPEDTEGDVHAHGFAWKDGSDSARFRGNLLFYVSMYDHLNQRGYAENVPLAPMCGCANTMPTVSRADCTEVEVEETYRVKMSGEVGTLEAERTSVEIDFNACDGATANDLYSEFAQVYEEDDDALDSIREYLVGPEDNDEPSNCPTSR